MGDSYDIHVRKIEIAWEIASAALAEDKAQHPCSTGAFGSEQYLKKAREHLKAAWSIVDTTFLHLPNSP